MKLKPIIQSEVSQKEKHQYSMLLLSRFSRVRLCVAPETAAHQAPPSLGFSGKNTGVGFHFLLQCMKVKSESEVAQSCLTLSDPMDCSLNIKYTFYFCEITKITFSKSWLYS